MNNSWFIISHDKKSKGGSQVSSVVQCCHQGPRGFLILLLYHPCFVNNISLLDCKMVILSHASIATSSEEQEDHFIPFVSF